MPAPRLRFIDGPSALQSDEFAQAVREGLDHEPKWLPSRFFYDRRGSELFEQITRLPEYYLTRCEVEILREHAPEIVEMAGPEISIVEFGSGSSTKTRRLISEAIARQGPLRYTTIDISRDFLRQSSEELLADYPDLRVTAIAAEYSEALDLAPGAEIPKLILFLGSSIGNFVDEEAIRFLRSVAHRMGNRDALLVGADLEKDREVLRLAYNDPQGVTAEFNRNLLARVNRELGGHFVLDRFVHLALYDEAEHRVEMRLISDCGQDARVDGLQTLYSFSKGEPIVTEWSHKYTGDSFERLARGAGLRICGQWRDSNGWFAEFLLRKE